MNSTNDNLPTKRHSIKAGVMVVRWLRAVASFILLKTKKGRDFFYITFVTFSNPKIAPMAKTPMRIFLGVNVLALLFLIALPLESNASIQYVVTPYLLSEMVVVRFTVPEYGCPVVCLASLTWMVIELPETTPSTTSPFLNCLVRYKLLGAIIPAGAGVVFGAVPLAALSLKNLYFAITNFFSMNWDKYTDFFLIFYKFAKFEVRGLFVFNKIKFPITVGNICSCLART